MKRVFVTGLLILLASCTITGNSVDEPDTIRLGVVAPLTGGPALWGQGSLNMIQLAADEINQNGGVNGTELTIVAEDGKCNPQAATKATQQLLRTDTQYILGGHCSPETIAMVPIVDNADAFMLAGVTAADGAVNGSNRAFRTSPPTIEQAQQITNIAERRGIDTIATVTEQATYAESFTRDVKKTFNGTIVETASYTPGTKDFKTKLLKIKQADPDAIWISPQDPQTAVSLLEDMHELNMLNTTMFGNTIFVSEQVDQSSNGLLPDDAFTVTLYANPNTPRFQTLQHEYKERYGEPIPYNNYYVAAAYDATYMLKHALEHCGQDTRCVADYFDQLKNYEGVAGNYTFEPNGDPVFDSWRKLQIVDGTAELSRV